MKYLENKVRYKSWDCRIGISYYNTNPSRKAIVAQDFHDGMPIATLTRNLEGLASDEVAIDLNNCGTEAQVALIEAGIIGPYIRSIASGYSDYPVHKLLIEP